MIIEKKTKIGGEFEINPELLIGLKDFTPSKQNLSVLNGRTALRIILKNLRKKKDRIIHIPYYICTSVIDSCIKSGYKPQFYELNEDFSFPLEYIKNIQSGGILLTVNYFGFTNENSIIKQINNERPDITIISDQVQSYWTFDTSIADYSFTSLRKHFPVIEGGEILCNNNNSFTNEISLEFPQAFNSKLIGSILKFYNQEDEIYLKFLDIGEKEYDKNEILADSSIISKFLFQSIDVEFCKKQRDQNYKLAYDIGTHYNIDFLFPFAEGITPLCIPILIPDRNKVREQLYKYNIFLPIHWPVNQYSGPSTMMRKISPNIISLVIDQRYSLHEIEYELMTLINILRNE